MFSFLSIFEYILSQCLKVNACWPSLLIPSFHDLFLQALNFFLLLFQIGRFLLISNAQYSAEYCAREYIQYGGNGKIHIV